MKGFQSPNHTQIPNDLFDLHLPDLGHAELKILLAILRQTLGFHRRKHRMSITAIQKATGLARSSVQAGCDSLTETGLVTRIKDKGVTLWVVNWMDHPPDMGVLGVPENGIDKDTSVPKTNTPYTDKEYEPIPITGTPSIKEKRNKKLKETISSKNQSTWIKALTQIGLTRYRLDPLKTQAPSFIDYWQPTEVQSEENGKIVIACVGEDPEYQRDWLIDRGTKIAENAMQAVTGKSIGVEFVTKVIEDKGEQHEPESKTTL